MTKRHSHKYKICRQLGDNLWNQNKIKFKSDKTPGEHGKKHKRSIDNRYEPLYATQLKEKQKIKKYYFNINEQQFQNYFIESTKIKGPIDQNLLILLERRLDTVLYRAGFASSMGEARQLINHMHVKINEHIVNQPSYSVKNGDIVKIKYIHNNQIYSLENPMYLEVNFLSKEVIFLRDPLIFEIPNANKFNIKSIIEFYNR